MTGRQTTLFESVRPEPSLQQFDTDLSSLSDAEYVAYQAVENEGYGVREYAREAGRSPGTVGNLLRRARRKLGEGDGQA